MKYLKTAVLATMVISGSVMADSWNWNNPRPSQTAPEVVFDVNGDFFSSVDSAVIEGNASGQFDSDNHKYDIKLKVQKDLGDGISVSGGIGGDQDGGAIDAHVRKTFNTDRGDLITLGAGADFSNGVASFVPSIEFVESTSGFGLSYSLLGIGFVEIKDGHKYRYSLDPITNMFQIATGQRTILHALSDALGMEANEMKGKEIVVNAKFFGSGHNWNNKPADKDNIKLYVNAAGQVSMVGWC